MIYVFNEDEDWSLEAWVGGGRSNLYRIFWETTSKRRYIRVIVKLSSTKDRLDMSLGKVLG